MDPGAVLTAYDQQIRQMTHGGPHWQILAQGPLITVTSAGGWSAVIWSDLDDNNAESAIRTEIARRSELGRPWEWKLYSYDRPADLASRLMSAGLVPDEVESLMVAEIADLTLEINLPEGISLSPVTDRHEVDAVVEIHDAVFGKDVDHERIGRELWEALGDEPASMGAVLAWAAGAAVGAGRVEFYGGTEFAALWGGGTVASWRRRGIFTALVMQRALMARDRGFRYLQVDAGAQSKPILEKLGFIELATTTPFHPAPPDSDTAFDR